MLTIDGSQGEGGGQILRTSLSLACLLGRELTVKNIRANRAEPGLKAQHLTVVKALQEICRAQVSGAEPGSTRLGFVPGKISGGKYRFDVGTAGSTVLVAQAVLPALLFAGEKSRVEIAGGTHQIMAPTYEYFAQVFLPCLRQLGASVESKLVRPGFYPKGGGKIELEIEPVEGLRACTWETPGNTGKGGIDPGETPCGTEKSCRHIPKGDEKIKAVICSSLLPAHVAEREKKEILAAFPEAEVEINSMSAECPGNALTIWQASLGASSIGRVGKPAEKVAAEALRDLKQEIKAGASCDRHLADQLLLYLALAQGEGGYHVSELTSHWKTNKLVLETFLGECIKSEGNKVTVSGKGWRKNQG